MQSILLDTVVDQTDFRTSLNFVVTSSRPMKTTLKLVKIIRNGHFYPAKSPRRKRDRVQCYEIKFPYFSMLKNVLP